MGGEYTGAGAASTGLRAVPRTARARAAAPGAPPPSAADGAGRCARQSAGADWCRRARRLLHRLPGAADLLGDEAGGAGTRRAPRRGRHRLPPVFDQLPPFNIGATTMGYGLGRVVGGGVPGEGGEAADRGDGRRRVLAQRAGQRHRQRRVQQARRRRRCWSTTTIPRPPAGRTFPPRAPTIRRAAPSIRSRRRCAASARAGCGSIDRTYDGGENARQRCARR